MAKEHEAVSFAHVAVNAPLLHSLVYKSSERLNRGDSVFVPLGHRRERGVVFDISPPKTSGEFTIRNVFEKDETRPLLSDVFLKWLEWLSEYYVHPLGQVAALAFPPLDPRKNSKPRLSKRPAVVKATELKSKPVLTEEQAYVVSSISVERNFEAHLVYGVTGSGKTEVYFRALENALQLDDGKGQGLVLVPEISLTPQLVQRFAERFGDQIAVLHSQLTDRERTDQWWSMVSGQKKILVGARSALFCPLPHLRLIVVDEEHEASYKQEEKLRYHARDAAVMLARSLNIPVILGSATPSLESWLNAKRGKYKLHKLERRVAERAMPQTEILDLRANKRESAPEVFWLSPQLESAMQSALERNEQTALFLNRRGIARTVLCGECGFSYQCPNCTIALTLHGERNLVCHFCDYHELLAEICPSCREGELKSLGLGTEQIERSLKERFPNARIARADRDEIHSRESLENLIRGMEDHDIDILVGTQMIAKGLDFPKLTLVGLVLADVGFNIPDFRSTERAYQLVTQMSGRAGRHQIDGGRVIVQTYNVEHPALQFALSRTYAEFADHELVSREEFGYPPFCKLAAIRVLAGDRALGEQTIEKIAVRAELLKKQLAAYGDIQILGPAEAPMARLRGQYRFHSLFKSKGSHLSAFCRQLLGDEKWIPSSTKVQVDIDPMSLL